MGWSRRRLRSGLIGLAVGGMLAGPAFAQVTTERSASILVFPKIVYRTGDPTKAGGTTTDDTEIQMSNTSNSVVYVHCFYVNAAPIDPELPPGPTNPPQWQEVDFDLLLTKQQPTHWVISEGRTTNPFDPTCSLRGQCIGGGNNGQPCEDAENDCSDGLCSNTVCNDAGFDPGRIPPVPFGFTGELKCIEVDQSGAPISGNHLKGEATILTTFESSGDPVRGRARKYNAIGVMGLDSNDSNNILCLGGGANTTCPAGAEYTGCPNVVFATHYADGANDPAQRQFDPTALSEVTTELTLVPCQQDFERQEPGKVIVQFVVYNEFEEPFSTSTTVECWGNFHIGEINPVFTIGSVGSRYVQTTMKPAGDDPGFVGVMEEIHATTLKTCPSCSEVGRQPRSIFNLHVSGERPTTDFVIIPEQP